MTKELVTIKGSKQCAHKIYGQNLKYFALFIYMFWVFKLAVINNEGAFTSFWPMNKCHDCKVSFWSRKSKRYQFFLNDFDDYLDPTETGYWIH